MLSVQLLGAPGVWLDGRPLKLTRRKSRALLYYLAAHTAPITRDHVLSLLWPDHSRQAAQQTLRTTLHGLRTELESSLVVADDMLALAPDTTVDARHFREQLAAPVSDIHRLRTALDLYHGPFLEGFDLPGSLEWDEWLSSERAHYRTLAIRGLTALAELHEASAHYTAALDALGQALSFDPLQEDLQRSAMRLQYLAGDRAAAIRRYEQLRTLLDDEMGVPPMQETRALYDAIIKGTLPIPSPLPAHRPRPVVQERASQPSTTDALPFVGRASEITALQDLSPGTLALIEGEPGLGKSRLVAEFIAGSGAIALVGAARELERGLPYQPLVEALRGLLARPEWPGLRVRLYRQQNPVPGSAAGLAGVWLQELARLLPELAPGPPGAQPGDTPDESRLWEAINQFLRGVARAQKVILFLDDLHWADASTLALLGYLVRQNGASPILFIATTHHVAPRAPLANLVRALTREDRLLRLLLTRLTADDVKSLARQLSPADPEPLAQWLDESAEGNPYILAELIRHAREQDLLGPGGVLKLPDLSAAPLVPPTVYSLIQARLTRLSDAARTLLDTAVAAGREWEWEVVARAAALPEPAALDALDELRVAALIHPLDGRRYSFDHSLIMEVAHQETNEPRRRLFHRRIAEALESLRRRHLDSVAGLLAWHFGEGGAPERAAPYAFRAGQLAAELAAFPEAIAFYEQALAGSSEQDKAAIYMRLGEAHFHAGDAPQAWAAFQSALRQVQRYGPRHGVDEDVAQLAIARSLLLQERHADIIALLEHVRARGQPENAASMELMWGTALSHAGQELDEAHTHLQAAEALLREQGAEADPNIQAAVSFELGNLHAQRGDVPRAVEQFGEALEIAERAPSGEAVFWQILAHNNLAYHLHVLDDPSAVEHARQGLRLAQDKGILGLQAYLFSTLGEIALAGADLDAAEQHLQSGLALAERMAIHERIAGITASLGLVALARGQPALALERLTAALELAQTLGSAHLEAQIHLWLASLLPPAEARLQIAAARAIAEEGNRHRMLDEIVELEARLPPG